MHPTSSFFFNLVFIHQPSLWSHLFDWPDYLCWVQHYFQSCFILIHHHVPPTCSNFPPPTVLTSLHIPPFKYFSAQDEHQNPFAGKVEPTKAHTEMRATLLLLLPLLCCPVGEAQQSEAAVREYHIAAVEIGWDYVHMDDADRASDPG